jgi:hypothetical protein
VKEEAFTRAQRAGTVPDIFIILTLFKEHVCKFFYSIFSATLRLSHHLQKLYQIKKYHLIIIGLALYDT